MNEPAAKNFIDLTTTIVSAYVSNNPMPASELPALIGQIHAALLRVSTGRTELPVEPAKPAVPVKKSMTADYLICLEDGKRFKSMRGHLRGLGITPSQYREKWNLPADYPMVAPIIRRTGRRWRKRADSAGLLRRAPSGHRRPAFSAARSRSSRRGALQWHPHNCSKPILPSSPFFHTYQT